MKYFPFKAAELEQTVKTGGHISLLNLANVVQAEKKEKKFP